MTERITKKGSENQISVGGVQEIETDNTVIKIQQYIFNNSKKISIVSVSFIVILVLLFIIKSSLETSAIEDSKKAIVALDRIVPYYEAPDYHKAMFGDSSKTVRGEQIIGLLEIVEKYGSTKQGKIAALYSGNSYLALGKASEAIEYFEIAEGTSSKLILIGVYAGLGSCYELLGDFEEAVDYYEKASGIAVSNAGKTRYNFYTALNYEKLGKGQDAEKIFRDIIAKGKFSEFASFSRAGLVRLGMIIE